jgi:outer membrane murein-binding lipoprotein Lpp
MTKLKSEATQVQSLKTAEEELEKKIKSQESQIKQANKRNTDLKYEISQK